VYRTIDTAIWTDPKFRALPGPARLLFIYLFSNSHSHVSGIYYLPDVMVLHESGVKPDTIDTLWDTLSKSGMVRRDTKNEVVWVVNMLRRQGMHEKTIAAAVNQLPTLHNSPLVQDFIDHYPEVAKGAKRKGIGRVSGSRLQEQEQKIKREPKGSLSRECDADGSEITPETIRLAYPKLVKPGAAVKAIRLHVRHLRKRGILTPLTWLLGRVRQYAHARREAEARDPDSPRFTPEFQNWLRDKRYDEEPETWLKEVGVGKPRAGGGLANGKQPKPNAEQRGEFREEPIELPTRRSNGNDAA